MSVDYSVATTLIAKYTQENIKKFVDAALQKGFIFITTISMNESRILNEEEAIHYLYERSRNHDIFVYIKKTYETYAHLISISNDEDGRLTIYLDLDPMKYKEYNDYKYVDFDHYIKYLLDLVEDFPIHSFKSEIDF